MKLEIGDGVIRGFGAACGFGASGSTVFGFHGRTALPDAR
jgi:hypothetical protein